MRLQHVPNSYKLLLQILMSVSQPLIVIVSARDHPCVRILLEHMTVFVLMVHGWMKVEAVQV